MTRTQLYCVHLYSIVDVALTVPARTNWTGDIDTQIEIDTVIHSNNSRGDFLNFL